MTKLKLKSYRLYWLRDESTDEWRMIYSNKHIGTAIPCDARGWVDAKTYPPPEIDGSCILVRSMNDDGDEFYHTLYFGRGWYDICGERCEHCTHWQPINEWSEP